MKQFNFLFTESKRTISRTYGGSNYTLQVYEVIKGETKHIGEVKACTRGHKGEESEAFGLIIKLRPQVIKAISRRCKKILEKDPNNYTAKNFDRDVNNSGGYYSWRFRELGLSLKKI